MFKDNIANRIVMNVSMEKFQELVQDVIDGLSDKFSDKINNLAFIIEDYPTKEQQRKIKLRPNSVLLGLYEGYHQSSRSNIGPVLPDRITIFRKAVLNQCHTWGEVKKQVDKTIRHELAHHFGSDELGARKAEKNK